MRWMPSLVLCTALGTLSTAVQAEEFGGIDFPGGVSSFADEVVSFDPLANGGPAPSRNDDPTHALGVPEDGTSVSLGRGGEIILRFTDNALTGSGNGDPDLHVFEIGPDVEDTFVAISRDGVTFFDIGKVFGSTSSIDIDAFGFGPNDQFNYVRLTDDFDEGDSSGSTVGADIDAVGAISSVTQTPNCGGIWFDPTQNGHGVTLFEENNIISGTFYTYDSFGEDTWLSFVGERIGNRLNVDLLRFTGPPLGTAFDPSQVSGAAVGSATFDFIDADTIEFDYVLDGVFGSMTLEPFSLVR